MFQSFPNDTYIAATTLAANQSMYSLQELLTAETLTESIALQWTANKQRILQQQLKKIYKHDILPLHLHKTFLTAIKFSGDIARQYLTECASDTSDNTDDEHSLPDSFTHS